MKYCRKYCAITLAFTVLSICWQCTVTQQRTPGIMLVDHPLQREYNEEIAKCTMHPAYCADNAETILNIAAKILNEYSALLLYERAEEVVAHSLRTVRGDSYLKARLSHMSASVAFAQGKHHEAETMWRHFCVSDLLALRTLAAQKIIITSSSTPHSDPDSDSHSDSDSAGIHVLASYANQLGERLGSLLASTAMPVHMLLHPHDQHQEQHPLVSNYSSEEISMRLPQSRSLSTKGDRRGAVSRSVGRHETKLEREQEQELEQEWARDEEVDEEVQDLMLALLLGEAQGGIRVKANILDLLLTTSSSLLRRPLSAKLRFRLGVGLAKLGLFDLSLKHVWLSATPWEAPLYKLRAQLVFPPVHTSVRSLALAVDSFERQIENILSLSPPPPSASSLPSTHRRRGFASSPLMISICNSPNEAALALQALPLLHLAGVAAPRATIALGHSPVALPVLLGEVFGVMCPFRDAPLELAQLNQRSQQMQEELEPGAFTHSRFHTPRRRIKVGIVAGSFDDVAGKIVVGILQGMRGSPMRNQFELIGICFPTPRGRITDLVRGLFDSHINLPPDNRAEAMSRILASRTEFLLFADAALDSRVFALTHERLAMFQGALWGWGGTLGIPTLDFYVVPEVLWRHSRCQVKLKSSVSVPPQTLFHEQVVLLEGLPDLPLAPALTSSPHPLSHPVPNPDPPAVGMREPVSAGTLDELRGVLRSRYLLPVKRGETDGSAPRVHLFLVPGSVKHVHPEFDPVFEIILKTDPLAMIVLAVPRTGRDDLPTTHLSARHDLMHPRNPAAGVAKLRQRLRARLGGLVRRVRVMPPLDEQLYRALVLSVVAVLDPFPVGLHVPIIEALLDGVPVVTAAQLQECTNSHAFNIAHHLNVSAARLSSHSLLTPSTSSSPHSSGSGSSSPRGLTGFPGFIDEDAQKLRSAAGFSPNSMGSSSPSSSAAVGSTAAGDIIISSREIREGLHVTAAAGTAGTAGTAALYSDNQNGWLLSPTTAEEYAVLAVRLSEDWHLRAAYSARPHFPPTRQEQMTREEHPPAAAAAAGQPLSHGSQLLRFLKTTHAVHLGDLEWELP